MSDLKPCPFCGGEVEVFEYKQFIWAIEHAETTDCVASIFARWVFDTEAEAIEAWNRRANDGE